MAVDKLQKEAVVIDVAGSSNIKKSGGQLPRTERRLREIVESQGPGGVSGH